MNRGLINTVVSGPLSASLCAVALCSACGASDDVVDNKNPVADLTLAGVTPAADFSTSGLLTLRALPADAAGGAVFSVGLAAEVELENGRLLSDFTSDKEAAKAAANEVEAFGITPLYESVIEVLEYFDGRFDASDGNRTLLVLGDGRPNYDRGMGTLELACAKATETGISINTIGFGPAADVNRRQGDAVKVLRDLADCSGGAYSAAAEAADLEASFEAQARVTTSGSVLISVWLNPVPPVDTTVRGTLSIRNAGQDTPATVPFEFVVQ